MKTLLVSNFEGGFQPHTVASAATALINAGVEVSVLDTYVEGIQKEKFKDVDLVAISIPLFDAVSAGIEISKMVREENPNAHITFFGQHATINANRLSGIYSDSCISGEWEIPLVKLTDLLAGEKVEDLSGILLAEDALQGKVIHPFMSRKHLDVPTRTILPPLEKYPQIQINKLLGSEQVVGTTEIARGCHHKCLYCSVFAAYDGKVILVPEDIVISDVRNLVNQGMTHLTFIDADFFNAKYHGIKILRKLNEEFPFLTYDFTTRVDHILENQETLKEMKELNVKFITSALEFPSKEVLDEVAKDTSIEDIEGAISFLRETGIKLNPTFIMFNPWTKLEDLSTFRAFVADNQLEDIIDPIQYETRLYLYKGSPLLQRNSIQSLDLTEYEFHYEWKHPDPSIDELYFSSLTPQEEGIFKRCCLKC
ncbi:radical SAM protein [Priestia aryabhattai]|uniref:arsinothricin biosynthesis radical SAM protein ArsL n=1 Tax=Bacillaceae TaxID=186817 RepID=UPI000BA13E65|nr:MULTISPECIES: RCCLKC-tail radical SAM protein [Bacillaceae]OZT10696.1 radical SAM protein [Priestia aryabhattai]MCA1204150.1 radical SAM protein [Priestia flexa]MCG7315466.1 RCCLKC-tail radical SAM protein [Priestia flexa]QCS54126.1 radical SAM protein [Priestia flexa]WHX79805.1 RCCLKC-tail radical SAM protein [Priestia flexa]